MTNIEWTEKTWNPVVGCSIVSPGCTNCYAMRMAARLEAMSVASETRTGGDPGPLYYYRGLTQESRAGWVWTGKVKPAPEDVLTKPLRWRKPRVIFVNSMSDLFHEDVPDEWIDRVFAVMALTPQHTYQVLTKRSARMRDYMGTLAGDYSLRLPEAADVVDRDLWPAHVAHMQWPLPNVWLGVSCERQQEADERIPDLLAIPAAVRFVSAEPLLSPLDLSKWLDDGRREGISGASGARLVQGRAGRHDLASGQMDGRRCGVGPDLHTEAAGGAKHRRAGQLPQNIVQGRPGPAESGGASNSLDGREQATNSGHHGDQPPRRQQAEQRASELGARDAPAERAALPHAPCAQEEGPARREELVSGGDGSAGYGDTCDLGQSRPVATGDRREVRDHPIDGLGDRCPQELGTPSISWIIVGGESGPNARPMHPDWARAIRDQCAEAGVPFFFKQWGEWKPLDQFSERLIASRPPGVISRNGTFRRNQTIADPPEHMFTLPVGKSRAGRLLDGREHSEWPRTEMRHD